MNTSPAGERCCTMFYVGSTEVAGFLIFNPIDCRDPFVSKKQLCMFLKKSQSGGIVRQTNIIAAPLWLT
jgi:hypothetical protein